ncbi:unnamed protein product [Plutella xylostella]|uniref:(diamondback moth) hypothetical protein n=1 Tax=Plutella xylostella TaxID=51655 RepID=A0A8S4G4I8_PLUXY|nr:unnamed protein product [Plutella xylostella]
MDFKMHEYTHAIVGTFMPVLRVGEGPDYSDARRQHDCYLRLLRELNLDVVELDLGGTFPSNVVLEDLAIVCHGIALLTKPASKADEQKSRVIKGALRKLGQTIVEVTDPEAKLIGSDVLFTGSEFFVGICETSNEAGASAVAEAFPEFPCTPIKLPKDAQHIKKYISIAGSNDIETILCIGESKEAKELLKKMEREASFPYKTLTVPEDEAANCLYLNGTLVHRAIEEIPDSFKVFCEKIDYARRSICFSELTNVSNGLTSCCLLLRKT